MTTVTIPNDLMNKVKDEFEDRNPYIKISKTAIIINILSEYIKNNEENDKNTPKEK